MAVWWEAKPGPDLATWDEVSLRKDWDSLLIGNGASRAVWNRFAYPSLKERATSDRTSYALAAGDLQQFQAAATDNFELVLAQLATAKIVVAALLGDLHAVSDQIAARYESIRRALVAAILLVHIRHAQLGDQRLLAIGKYLGQNRFIYSTNYDLLAYWAAMKLGSDYFYDFFSGDPLAFRTDNTKIFPSNQRTQLFYLHGAVHLYSDGGLVRKLVGGAETLLDVLAESQFAPLVVAEGTGQQKREVIASHEYLTFALGHLERNSGPMVVFGSAFGDNDGHVFEALAVRANREVAVSVHLDIPIAVTKFKARASLAMPGANLSFFDARSHPLGMSSLRVPGTDDGA